MRLWYNDGGPRPGILSKCAPISTAGEIASAMYENARPQALIARIADRQMATPLLLFVAAHRPLAFFAGQTLYAAAPLAALMGWRQVDAWAAWLSEPDAAATLEAAVADRTPPGSEAHGLE